MKTKIKLPAAISLRNAHSTDIVHGAVIWYPAHGEPGHEEACKKIVMCVNCPSDPHKAFTADDGTRYGLKGAYIIRKSRKRKIWASVSLLVVPLMLTYWAFVEGLIQF